MSTNTPKINSTIPNSPNVHHKLHPTTKHVPSLFQETPLHRSKQSLSKIASWPATDDHHSQRIMAFPYQEPACLPPSPKNNQAIINHQPSSSTLDKLQSRYISKATSLSTQLTTYPIQESVVLMNHDVSYFRSAGHASEPCISQIRLQALHSEDSEVN